MYTILVNDDKTLTTTVATLLFRGESVQPIQVLIKDGFYQLNFDKVEVVAKYLDSENTLHSAILEKTEDIYKEAYHQFIFKMDDKLFDCPSEVPVFFEVSQIDEETGEGISVITDSTTVSIVQHSGRFTVVWDELKHKKNEIFITRGDTMSLTLSLYDEYSSSYTPETTDSITFRVKKNAISKEILIEKPIDIELLSLTLVEDDTKDLAFGTYRYEVELKTTNGDKHTVIKNAKFIVGKELENHGDYEY